MRLGLDTTIPSHETIGRVFGMRISPTSLTRGSGARWVGYVGGLAWKMVVAIDGKTSWRSGSKGKIDVGGLPLVSAFAVGMGVVLGWTRPRGHRIPQLLANLAI